LGLSGEGLVAKSQKKGKTGRARVEGFVNMEKNTLSIGMIQQCTGLVNGIEWVKVMLGQLDKIYFS